MNNLLIVDDNEDFVINIFNNAISNISNIRLSKIVTNGEEALTVINNEKPNIILLDLLLPKKSGIEILNELEKLISFGEYHPYVIVISGMPELLKKLKNYRILYKYYLKPVDVNQIIETVRNISNKLEEKNISNFIDKELEIYKFNKSRIAYQYLKESILIGIKYPEYINNLLNKLFQEVAYKYNKNALTIKWSIEKLISSSYKYNYTDKSSKDIIHSVVKKYINNI